MAKASARELRIHTRAVLARVESGESITITLNGRPVARLEPIPHRRRWISREAFIRDVLPHQADPGLREELRTMLPSGDLSSLEREGLLRRGEGDLLDIAPILMPPDVDRPSELVEDGRADRAT